MARHSKALQLIAYKLGLSDDDKILSKAAEFERLLQMKSLASSVTDTGRVVICLDLAASLSGADIDLKTAIKYSGLKSSVYMTSKKVVENLLVLNSDKLTTTVLCGLLHCGAVQELADKILSEYRRKSKIDIDLILPQYVCMAVNHSCRLSKVKVSKSMLIGKSRLKPAQWAKLDLEWTKFVDENFATTKARKKQPASTSSEVVEEKISNESTSEQDKETDVSLVESYEDWKQRILQTAQTKLKQLEAMHNKQIQTTESPKKLINKSVSEKPRRSPRKTPYYSPNKVKEVKLLQGTDQDTQNEQMNKVETKQLSRSSPRKTQRLETAGPVKLKGVRLLFPANL